MFRITTILNFICFHGMEWKTIFKFDCFQSSLRNILNKLLFTCRLFSMINCFQRSTVFNDQLLHKNCFSMINCSQSTIFSSIVFSSIVFKNCFYITCSNALCLINKTKLKGTFINHLYYITVFKQLFSKTSLY